LYDAETLTLRKVYPKYLGSFTSWCWRRVENIRWTDRVRNDEVLYRVNTKTLLDCVL